MDSEKIEKRLRKSGCGWARLGHAALAMCGHLIRDEHIASGDNNASGMHCLCTDHLFSAVANSHSKFDAHLVSRGVYAFLPTRADHDDALCRGVSPNIDF